jgi:hypothetical protein
MSYMYKRTGIPIQQAIRDERMRIEDIEWDTGVSPSDVWLKFLEAEAARGQAMFYNGLEAINAVTDEKK